jgi:hypothetical protein
VADIKARAKIQFLSETVRETSIRLKAKNGASETPSSLCGRSDRGFSAYEVKE